MGCVERALQEAGLAAHYLELELTESILMDNVEDTLACHSALKALGVRFAMDDFGSGYSSLNYLQRFPFDNLKLDKSFIRDIDVAAIMRKLLKR